MKQVYQTREDRSKKYKTREKKRSSMKYVEKEVVIDNDDELDDTAKD